MLLLRRADLVATRGTAWVSRAIRVCTRSRGEPPTVVNHVGIITVAGPLNSAQLTEAIAHVVERGLFDAYHGRDQVAVFRCKALTDIERDVAAEKARSYIGRDYGYVKIAAHLFDYGLSRLFHRDTYLARRLARMDKSPMCSWLDEHAFAVVRRFFGVPFGTAEPDDLWDYVTAHPDEWECVLPLSQL